MKKGEAGRPVRMGPFRPRLCGRVCTLFYRARATVRALAARSVVAKAEVCSTLVRRLSALGGIHTHRSDGDGWVEQVGKAQHEGQRWHEAPVQEPRDAEGEAAKRIVLSKKTGMPIGFFPTAHAAAGTGDGAADNEDDGPCDDDVPRASTYRPRGKQETSEERRARKQAVKLERRHNRARKKDLRNQFKSSEMKLRDLKDNPPTIPL